MHRLRTATEASRPLLPEAGWPRACEAGVPALCFEASWPRPPCRPLQLAVVPPLCLLKLISGTSEAIMACAPVGCLIRLACSLVHGSGTSRHTHFWRLVPPDHQLGGKQCAANYLQSYVAASSLGVI